MEIAAVEAALKKVRITHHPCLNLMGLNRAARRFLAKRLMISAK